jgi:hypothetical protein
VEKGHTVEKEFCGEGACSRWVAPRPSLVSFKEGLLRSPAGASSLATGHYLTTETHLAPQKITRPQDRESQNAFSRKTVHLRFGDGLHRHLDELAAGIGFYPQQIPVDDRVLVFTEGKVAAY